MQVFHKEVEFVTAKIFNTTFLVSIIACTIFFGKRSTSQSSIENDRHSYMVRIQSGSFMMGSASGEKYERPVHSVHLSAFWIDQYEVTVRDFGKFVKETKYITDAEKSGWSVVFDTKKGEGTTVIGANWRQPEGPNSRAYPRHPVCQVSWNDAQAYALWRGKRLPTEAEWEYAARGRLQGKMYPWGDQLKPNGRYMANLGTHDDGYASRSPVGAFPSNGYRLFDIAGNVWEWTSSLYKSYPYKVDDGREDAADAGRRVVRGGSFDYGVGLVRCACRSHDSPGSRLDDLGFRVMSPGS